ncbi:nitrogen assimilation transcription factor nira [Fusarium oxysporum f. sp. phaseoli]
MRKLLPKSRDKNQLPPPPPPAIGKRKRVQVLVACEVCRRRKIKCDNRRPTCSQCIRSVSECHFSISDDKTQHDALAHQLQVVSEGESSLKTILDLLRGSSKNESINLLNSIREAQSVNDFVKTFTDASLLLPNVPQRLTYKTLRICPRQY